MHVASLAIYDPSTAPGGGVRFKNVLRFFASRVAQFPQFRRRLVSLPLSLDRPYWVESSNLDVEFHVRHIALPHPGDWRQLCIQVARLHSRPLDRSKPLWEAYVIEGLHDIEGVPPGSFALYTKLHHAFVDGESGTELLKALHTLTPEALDEEQEEQAANRVFPADRDPTAAELYSRALVHNVQNVPSLARFAIDTTRRLASLGAPGAGAVPLGQRQRLAGQRTRAARRRPDEAAAAHAAGDSFQRQGFGTPGCLDRRAVDGRVQADPPHGARGNHQRPVPVRGRRGGPSLSFGQKGIAGNDLAGHGADHLAWLRQERRRQPGRRYGHTGAHRDRGSDGAPACDLPRREKRQGALRQARPGVDARLAATRAERDCEPDPAQREAPWAQPRGVERARPGRAALHGGRTDS